MKLAKYENSSDWFVISDIGRKYDLAMADGLISCRSHDIVIIFDFDVDEEIDKKMRVVDFFYGANDFIKHPENALDYIKNAITKYERNIGCYNDKMNIEVIKEF